MKVSFTDYASLIWLSHCSKLAINQKIDNDVTICRYDVIVIFFGAILFFFLSLVTCRSFMSISSLVLELWQFYFKRDWAEIRKSEIPQSEFCPLSGEWGELRIPNLARMSLLKCHWILLTWAAPSLVAKSGSTQNRI